MRKELLLVTALLSGGTLSSCGSLPPAIGVQNGSVTFEKPAGVNVTVKNHSGTEVDAAKYKSLSAGKYTATFSQEGFESVTQEFTVKSGQTTTVTAPTLKLITGSMTIDNPAGYTVSVTDSAGESVSSLDALRPGTYRVTFSKAGFIPQTLEVTVTGGQSTSVTAPTLSVSSGVLSIKLDPEVTVTVRNSSQQTVPESQWQTMSPGSYTATFSKPGYFDSPQGFTIVAGQTTTLSTPALTKATGSLSITNPAGYTVSVKDAQGNAVTDLNALTPGTYNVTFSKPGYTSQTRQVVIKAGETLSLSAPVLTLAPINDRATQYLDKNGVAQPVTSTDPARYRLLTWVSDQEGGVDVNKLSSGTPAPSSAEQNVTALSGQQVVAVAYTEYLDDGGEWRALLGSKIEWTSTNAAVLPSTADDNTITQQTATTYTNYASGTNSPMPVTRATNVTGVSNVNTTGLSWTAWSSDPAQPSASTSVRVNASVLVGQTLVAIDQQWLRIQYASNAKPELYVTADVTTAPSTSVTKTVTVRNTGAGTASDIKVQIAPDTTDATKVVTTFDNSVAVDEKGTANVTFTLAPMTEKTFTYTVKALTAGTYCENVTISSYVNSAFGTVTAPTTRKTCTTAK